MKPQVDFSIYLVLDPAKIPKGKSIENMISEAVLGGVRIVQLRNKTHSVPEIVEMGKKLKKLLLPFEVPLVINDHPNVALAIGADGVHVGQNDVSYYEARKILGQTSIIGLSITNIEEAKIASKYDVDYLGVGPIFHTISKLDAAPPMGLEVLKQIRKICPQPIVAIGGISIENTKNVIHSGADGVALISAIGNANDPQLAVNDIKTEIMKGRNDNL